jgi:ferredoxin
MNIDVSHPDAVGSPECISCMECVTTCPTKKNTLRVTLAGKSFQLRTVVILGFAKFGSAAVVGQAAGMLEFAAPSLSAMAAEGKLMVEDIKGSSTWAMVADSFGIELERLYREAGVDPKQVPSDAMIKDTGTLTGIEDFEADAVRIAVAKILGIPYAGETAEVEPAAAAPAPAPAATPAATSASLASGGALTVPADFELEGTMSLTAVATALKSTTAAVAVKLGLPADAQADIPLRDLKDTYGFTMPELKERIKQ